MYTLVKGDWIVEVKHGAGWRHYGVVSAVTDTNAARKVRKSWGNYRNVRVRPDIPGEKWRYIKFTYPRELN